MISLNKSEINNLWEDGILSTTAYVYLALRYDGNNAATFNMDVGSFADDWRGVGDGEKKPKTLTEEQVIKALADLQRKEKIEMGARQLTLQLF